MGRSLKMETIFFSETLLTIKTTQCHHIQEEHIPHFHRRENPKSHRTQGKLCFRYRISVSIVSDCWLDSRGSILDTGTGFFPLTSTCRPALGPTQPPVQWVPGALSLGVKRGRGVMLTSHTLLVPRLRKSRRYTSSSPPPQPPPWRVARQLYFLPCYKLKASSVLTGSWGTSRIQ
jgi:hypothetical protein